ncbi:MAG: DNA-methyltransferase [Anaerolineae bacterium]
MSQVTHHRVVEGDARDLSFLQDESVHLIVTSPPYWTLKRYRDHPRQLGHVAEYEQFLMELEKTWRECYRVLVPGGRLVCVVGDVCLSRREHGRHMVVPLHADIAVCCRRLGFDNLNPIIWHKISNASYEVNNGSKFLGKPYEPNAIIKNDIEFILMQRKPGGYRKPTEEQRQLSMIDKKSYDQWFQQFWRLGGASTREHPAPFPLELAYRLVRMFSFVGDTVLDPFCGTGTTMLAAMRADRNSIGVDVDPVYCDMAFRRLLQESNTLFGSAHVEMLHAAKAEGLTKAASADGARDNGIPSPRLYHQPPQIRQPALIRENAASSSDESVPGSD